jgi:hypothetical protein
MVLAADTGQVPPVLTTLRTLDVCKFIAKEAAILVEECFHNLVVYLQ